PSRSGISLRLIALPAFGRPRRTAARVTGGIIAPADEPGPTPDRSSFPNDGALPCGWADLVEGCAIPSDGGSPMEIVPLGPGFAAELRGVTLAEIAADDAAYKQTRAALGQHSGIVFRGQEVTDEAQLAFSRRFGPLEVTKVGSLGAGTNLVILSTNDENGKVVPADHRLALRNKANQLW